MEPGDLAKYGFKDAEKDEETRNGPFIPTGYPKPLVRYRMYIEGFNISVEEPYFWVLDYLKYFHGFPYIDKITDIFAAAENSAFFGASQQRLGAQQDKVSQFLATIGKMVKELFQIVRELRVLDERLGYYADSYNPTSKSRESAEITLKGIWIDMVEQGAKNPASVYGMAREVQFTTLPDLFFSTHPLKQEDTDEVVERERGQFNRKVREVLKRKLRAYLAWKEHTYEELKNRRKFTLKYLRQHYEIIKMYMSWAKPYLKNIKRLTLDQRKVDTADLVVAFETSMIEIEILARKPHPSGLNQVILLHYLYRTRPEMNYAQEYQRGPVHVGRVMIDFRSYVWTDEQIKKYKSMRDEEDFRLMEVIDASLRAAMDALGDELMKYLREAGEDIDISKPKETPPKYYGALGSILKGLAATFTNPKPAKKPKVPKDTLWKQEVAQKTLKNDVRKATWGTYHHFKKHHAMLNWGK